MQLSLAVVNFYFIEFLAYSAALQLLRFESECPDGRAHVLLSLSSLSLAYFVPVSLSRI